MKRYKFLKIFLLLIFYFLITLSFYLFFEKRRNFISQIPQYQEEYYKNFYLFLEKKFLLDEPVKKIKKYSLKEEELLKKEFSRLKNELDYLEIILKKNSKFDELGKNKILNFFQFYEELKQNKNKITEKYFNNCLNKFVSLLVEKRVILEEKEGNFVKKIEKITEINDFYLNVNFKIAIMNSIKHTKEELEEKIDQNFYGQKELKKEFIDFYYHQHNKFKFIKLISCPSGGKTTFINTVAKSLNLKIIKTDKNLINEAINKGGQVILLENNSKLDKLFFQQLKKQRKYFDFNNVLFFEEKNDSKCDDFGKNLYVQKYQVNNLLSIFKNKIVPKKNNEIKLKIFNFLRENNIKIVKDKLFKNFQIEFEKFFFVDLIRYCHGKNEKKKFDSHCECTTITSKRLTDLVHKILYDICDEIITKIKKTNITNEIEILKILDIKFSFSRSNDYGVYSSKYYQEIHDRCDKYDNNYSRCKD